MFVARLLMLLLVVAALMWLLKRLFSGSAKLEKQEQKPQSENMLQCKYCGVHVPESSIITVDDQTYCSREHADLDQQH